MYICQHSPCPNPTNPPHYPHKAWLRLLTEMKAARATIEQQGSGRGQGHRGFGPVWEGRAALTVDCASVQGQVALKYDAWQREFQVRFTFCVLVVRISVENAYRSAVL